MAASDPPFPATTSTAPRSSDHPIEVKVRAEFVRMAYGKMANSSIAVSVVAVFFAVALHTAMSSPVVWWWLGVTLAISGCRLWLGRAFRLAAPSSAECPPWGLRFVVSTTLTALAWGATPWAFPKLHEGGPLGTAHVLVLTAITAASAGTLLPMRKGGLAYLLAIMVPLGLRYFADGDFPGIALGLSVGVFIAYMAYTAATNHRTLSSALAMRFEREILAAELTAENSRREARETELQEAREKAESASKAKGEFIATIGHEIRTPMNGVLGMLRVVRDTELSPEQRSYLRTASDSAEALLLLLNDVLDFSKIEAGGIELERAPFPPAAAAKAVADLMQARARDKGLQFDVRIGDNLPGVVIGDATRLRQVVLNLLGNAIKFTEKGRVELAVTCVERSRSKGRPALHRDRLRHRHRFRRDGPALQALQSSRQLHEPALRRHRPRPGDLAAPRPSDGRNHPGAKHAGPRLDFPTRLSLRAARHHGGARARRGPKIHHAFPPRPRARRGRRLRQPAGH
ncbi:MAG: hypothetical protein EXS32_00870 [Opitutus sp.]|nr:hypothetical protein [Opitutus sp.]